FNVTPLATPGPPFATLIVKPSESPALTVPLSAVLVTDSDGFRHWTLSEPCASGAFDALAVAVLSYFVQAVNDVAALMCPVWPAPAARSTAEQSSSWLPTAPLTTQVAEPELPSTTQPAAVVPAGSGSFNVTPFAVPGPLFFTRIVNPIGSPA